MSPLKPLGRDSIDGALAKAERYRLLNEPGEAESICLDILEVDPGNQPARIALLLALSDQFVEESHAFGRARDVVASLDSEYDRAYYGGLIAERRAKALRPAGNDDAVLRWNACVRFLERHPYLRPGTQEREEIEMLE
jgi:hypothetical protein